MRCPWQRSIPGDEVSQTQTVGPLVGPEFWAEQILPMTLYTPSLKVQHFTVEAIMNGEAEGDPWKGYLGYATLLMDTYFGNALYKAPNTNR